jgi:hypothetical protein
LGTAEHCLLLWSRMDAELLAGLHVEGGQRPSIFLDGAQH